MNNKTFWLLLLLPACPALSDSLITCQPEEISNVQFMLFIFLFFISLFLFAFISLYWYDNYGDFELFSRRTPFIIIAYGILIYVAVLTFNLIRNIPTHLVPTINKETILSSPEVVRGTHYKDECIIISKNSETVELSCKPEAAIESVSTEEYAGALDALNKANEYIDDLLWQIRKTNICQPTD